MEPDSLLKKVWGGEQGCRDLRARNQGSFANWVTRSNGWEKGGQKKGERRSSRGNFDEHAKQ